MLTGDLRFLADVSVLAVVWHDDHTDGLLPVRWQRTGAYCTSAGAVGADNERSCSGRHARPSHRTSGRRRRVSAVSLTVDMVRPTVLEPAEVTIDVQRDDGGSG